VLPINSYQGFIEMLIADDFAMCILLSQISKSIEELSYDMTDMYLHLDKEMNFIKRAITLEIENTSDPNVIFLGLTRWLQNLWTI